VESQRLRARHSWGLGVLGLIAALVLALTVLPAHAKAASPVLEFVSPGNSFPISFEAEGGEVSARLAEFDPIVECSGSEGEGEITGPRSTLSSYVFTGCKAHDPGGPEDGNKCKSEDANAGEIRSQTIEADLVYIDQAKHEVAMLLNPDEGVYMNFECGGESVKASGSFLSPVDPTNKIANSFTAILRRSGASQLPSEYENANGEKRQAIPMGQKGTDPPDKTGVELSFTITPSVPLEIKAITAAEVEAKQHEEEAAAAAAKKHQEDEAAAKKHQEEETAAKKRQEEEAALTAKKHQEEAEAKARKRHLTKALKQCKKVKPGQKRARCVKRAKKKYGSHKGNEKPQPVGAYRLNLTAARRF
jgi:hypothetical protein